MPGGAAVGAALQVRMLTLTCRLASYWAPLCAGPIAYGLFRIRYRRLRAPPHQAGAGV